MAKKNSMMRWGKGSSSGVVLEGGDELLKKLELMGQKALSVLKDATHDGANAVFDDIKNNAPGSKSIVMVDSNKPRGYGVYSVDIGPDREHWFYQFFETGVRPYEINMAKKRSKRASGRGRKIKSDKQAMSFGGQVFKKVVRGPMIARPFLRNNFLPRQKDIEDAFGDTIKREVLLNDN